MRARLRRMGRREGHNHGTATTATSVHWSWTIAAILPRPKTRALSTVSCYIDVMKRSLQLRPSLLLRRSRLSYSTSVQFQLNFQARDGTGIRSCLKSSLLWVQIPPGLPEFSRSLTIRGRVGRTVRHLSAKQGLSQEANGFNSRTLMRKVLLNGWQLVLKTGAS